jgi:hypothetical protein
VRFTNAAIQKILISLIFFSLAPGFTACTKGQGPTDQTGGALDADKVEKTDTAKPACGTPEFKDHPGCRLVNTSFYGHFRIGAVKLEGVIKNSYDATGKLLKQNTYPEADSTQTIMEVDYNYNAEGTKHVVTTLADLQPVPGDLVMDTQVRETWGYNPEGKPLSVSIEQDGTLNTAGDPVLVTTRGYQYNSPAIWVFSQATKWSNVPTVLGIYMELCTINPDAYPERITKLWVSPVGAQETLEDHTYVYDSNGKPVSSTGKVFHCPDQPASTVPPQPAGLCATGTTATGAILNDNGVPYGVQNVTWKYDDKGRVSRMDVEMDGDMYAYDPAAKKGKMGPTGGAVELTWWCDFSYDDTWPEPTIAAYPKEFEIFGVSTNDKIESIVCKDTTDVVSAELHFDKWSYLHEVHADVEGPQ